MRPKKHILLLGVIEAERSRLAYVLGVRLTLMAKIEVVPSVARMARELNTSVPRYDVVIVLCNGMRDDELAEVIDAVLPHQMHLRTIGVDIPLWMREIWPVMSVTNDVSLISDAVKLKLIRKRGPKKWPLANPVEVLACQ